LGRIQGVEKVDDTHKLEKRFPGIGVGVPECPILKKDLAWKGIWKKRKPLCSKAEGARP